MLSKKEFIVGVSTFFFFLFDCYLKISYYHLNLHSPAWAVSTFHVFLAVWICSSETCLFSVCSFSLVFVFFLISFQDFFAYYRY